MIDLNYFDDYLPKPTDKSQIDDETNFLIDLAKNVGNYLYEYKDEYKEEQGANDKLNLGIMAQQLEKVPGLDASVITNTDGSKSVDSGRLALTTLGYVATLAKLILQMRGIEYDRSDNELVDEDIQRGEARGTYNDSSSVDNIRTDGADNTRASGMGTGDVYDETATSTANDVYANAANAASIGGNVNE